MGWNDILHSTEGSPIRRTGFQSFKRNVAIGLGNAPYHAEIIEALEQSKMLHDEIVNIHVEWAIQQQMKKAHSEQLS